MAQRNPLRRFAPLALTATLCLATGVCAEGADLFYNYYVPGYNGGPPAQLYVAPRPTPPLVGHTYVTYQPFYPHEMLYRHHRTYYRCGGRGILPANYTTVSWKSGLLGGQIWWPHRSPETMFQYAP
jgi:hypothetical protein